MNFRSPLILASASPRRLQLLTQIGIECITHPSNIDETPRDDEHPEFLVQRLAFQKAQATAQQYKDAVVIGADTIVYLDGKILGKPADSADAEKMLCTLSGRTHTVYTGFTLLDTATQRCICDYETANVTFGILDADDINAYVASGSPMDKAGAYGIQDDFGAVFVTHINGDYYTVVGLPLAKVYTALKHLLW